MCQAAGANQYEVLSARKTKYYFQRLRYMEVMILFQFFDNNFNLWLPSIQME